METLTCEGVGAVSGLKKRRRSSEKAVLALLREKFPDIQTGNFSRTVSSLFENEDYALIARRFNPDAYVVHEDEMILDIIEIVDTNPISLHKGSNIGILSDALIEEDWTVRVAVFNPLGDCISELPGIMYHPSYQDENVSSRDATLCAEATSRKFEAHDKGEETGDCIRVQPKELPPGWLEMFQKLAASPAPE